MWAIIFNSHRNKNYPLSLKNQTVPGVPLIFLTWWAKIIYFIQIIRISWTVFWNTCQKIIENLFCTWEKTLKWNVMVSSECLYCLYTLLNFKKSFVLYQDTHCVKTLRIVMLTWLNHIHRKTVSMQWHAESITMVLLEFFVLNVILIFWYGSYVTLHQKTLALLRLIQAIYEFAMILWSELHFLGEKCLFSLINFATVHKSLKKLVLSNFDTFRS